MLDVPIEQLTISRVLQPTIKTIHIYMYTYKHSYELDLKQTTNMLG